jgi:transcription termination/antitermination protein NusG
MTTPPTGFSDEPENDEPTGPLAEAFARLAAAPATVATEEPSEEAAAPEETVSDAAAATTSAEGVPVEVNEDAAAAAILQTPALEDAAPADEAVATEETAEDPDAVADEVPKPAAKTSKKAAKATPESAEAATEDEEMQDEESAEEILPPASPYDLPGGWYVVHSYSGYENKVKANLGTRIKSMHMEDSIFDIVIPMEDVVEIKSGRKVTVPRKQFPGYILVRMYMDDDSWGVVRNTPGVTGFVGSGTKPTPMPRREVERILGVRKDEEKKAPRFKPDWEVGETVRVIDGPFADFNGIIEDINMDQSKVRVLVDIFGRETPVELNFEQIQKF